MPRKKKTDTESTIPDAADILALEEKPIPRRRSKKKTEDIPFAEVLPETGSDDDTMDLPHFLEADEAPILSASQEADALDMAIEQARSLPQPLQEEPVHDLELPEEHPVSGAILEQQVSEYEVAPPPLMVLGFVGIVLIYFLAVT